MLKHLFSSAIRNLYKYRFFSLLNIAGLSIGMAASIMILSWTSFHLSFDKEYENHERIYRIVQHMQFEEEATWAITQGLLGAGLNQEIPGIENYCRLVSSTMPLATDSQEEYHESLLFVDTSFLSIFSIGCVSQGTDSPLDAPNSIVISQSLANRLYRGQDPLGRTIQVSELLELTITGVFPDVPENSHLQFDCLINFKKLEAFGWETEIWNNSAYYTYLLLEPSADASVVQSQIEHFLDDKPTLEEGTLLGLQPLRDIHRTTNLDFEMAQVVSNTYIKLFLLIGIFILLMACMNYINLDTAKASKRSKEIGIKRITGASSGILRKQFLGEAWVLSFIAVISAVIIVEFGKPAFHQITGIDIQFDLSDTSTYIYLLALWLLTGLIAGGYPSFYLSKIKPISIIKAKGNSSRSAVPLRTILVVFQFSLTIVFLISTLTVYKQVHHMQNTDLGYNKESIVYFRATPELLASYETLEQKLLNNPGIGAICLSGAPMTNLYNFSNSLWHWPGQDPNTQTLFRCVGIGYNFFETFEMQMAKGRTPSKEMTTDSGLSIILNQAAARTINVDDIVGTRMSYGDNNSPVRVIGVVKDFHYRSLHESVEPQILIVRPSACSIVNCRINEVNRTETVKQIKQICDELVPDQSIEVLDLTDQLHKAYQEDKTTGQLLILFTSLSILISILGLIGLMTFVSEQRIPEIGIRKTLGASNGSILKLFSWQYLRLLVLALIISWPAAYWGVQRFLQDYPYRMEMPYMLFLLAGLIVVLFVQITLIIVSLKTSRKAAVACLNHN